MLTAPCSLAYLNLRQDHKVDTTIISALQKDIVSQIESYWAVIPLDMTQ
jgi:hypothetical protein